VSDVGEQHDHRERLLKASYVARAGELIDAFRSEGPTVECAVELARGYLSMIDAPVEAVTPLGKPTLLPVAPDKDVRLKFGQVLCSLECAGERISGGRPRRPGRGVGGAPFARS
jgi:hypothetical protein